MKNSYYIYGKHAVLAAIKNKARKILEIICTTEGLRQLPTHTHHKIVSTHEIKAIAGEVPHQGIIAKVIPIVCHQIHSNILSSPASKIIILDQITDPQNLGAILRSAAAFGISAVLYPKHGSACENGSVAKAACGALDIVPLVEITNISQTILELKKAGFWIIGLDGSATQTIAEAKHLFDGKLCIIMGSEGAGMRQLVAKNCDMLVKLPISSSMESLNVSNAASIVMWEASKS